MASVTTLRRGSAPTSSPSARLQQIADEFPDLVQAVVEAATDLVFESVVEGSALTGAPGQPVESGKTKGSWKKDLPEPLVGEVYSDWFVARFVEEGQGMTVRSATGGFHSVKLTRAAFPNIVDEAVKRVVGGA